MNQLPTAILILPPVLTGLAGLWTVWLVWQGRRRAVEVASVKSVSEGASPDEARLSSPGLARNAAIRAK